MAGFAAIFVFNAEGTGEICLMPVSCRQSLSSFHGNGVPLYLFVSTQFQTGGYSEGAEPNRSHFSWNCSRSALVAAQFAKKLGHLVIERRLGCRLGDGRLGMRLVERGLEFVHQRVVDGVV